MANWPPEGFEGFYEDRFDLVLRATVLAVGSEDEAADIAQEAFARTWTNWDRVRHWDEPVRFTLRVARNLSLSRFRRLARIRGRPTLANPSAGGDPTETWTDAMMVRSAVLRLPPRQRWALVLTDLLDLNSEDAASLLRINPSTLRVHLARARSKLRETLKGELHEIGADGGRDPESHVSRQPKPRRR